MEPEVLVLQHAAPEHLGTIEPRLRAAGLRPSYIRPYAGEPLPDDPTGAAGLVVLGGPMGVYQQETHPHLAAEMRLIEQALKRELPVLGICLGAQLLAAVLGSQVAPGPRKEIGWHPVTLSPAAASDQLFSGAPRSFDGFHWHGDVFTLPEGAIPLGRSPMTELQAFRYGATAWGVLFHLEVTEQMVHDMVATFAEELGTAGLTPAIVLRDLAARIAGLQIVAAGVFDRWIDMVRAAE
jgi:GMP synthase (glutamine-hydrolysing)